jgi:hypothetical protein
LKPFVIDNPKTPYRIFGWYGYKRRIRTT